MAFIHVKRIGNKNYYTLRVSIRKGDKVITKDLENLGSDLGKVNIDDLEKKHKKEIRKSYYSIKKFLDTNYYLTKVKKLKLKRDDYLSKEQQYETEAIKYHFNKKFKKSNILTQKESFDNHILNFAVNSSSIEGNTITIKEAHKLFSEDILPKNRTLREVYDLKNTKKVVTWLKEKNPKINIELIIKIHDQLLENIDKRIGIRNHDIRIAGQPFKPTPARYVKADLKILLKWYEKNKNKFNPLVLVTLFHHKFEKIHPFSDGNGRTGRVLINHILTLLGLPPIIISRRFRKEYLDKMNNADKALTKSLINTNKKYYQNLIDFLISQYIYSYWDIFLT